MAVRIARPGDIAAMHAVRMAVRENPLSDPGRITAVDYLLNIGRDGQGWVAEHAGRIAGFAVGLKNGNVWALFVHPDFEGQGHGRALHAVLVDWFQAQKIEQAWLSTTPGTRAEDFYRRQGWRDAGLDAGGERRFTWAFRDDRAD